MRPFRRRLVLILCAVLVFCSGGVAGYLIRGVGESSPTGAFPSQDIFTGMPFSIHDGHSVRPGPLPFVIPEYPAPWSWPWAVPRARFVPLPPFQDPEAALRIEPWVRP